MPNHEYERKMKSLRPDTATVEFPMNQFKYFNSDIKALTRMPSPDLPDLTGHFRPRSPYRLLPGERSALVYLGGLGRTRVSPSHLRRAPSQAVPPGAFAPCSGRAGPSWRSPRVPRAVPHTAETRARRSPINGRRERSLGGQCAGSIVGQ